jgi:hypothetical protein
MRGRVRPIARLPNGRELERRPELSVVLPGKARRLHRDSRNALVVPLLLPVLASLRSLRCWVMVEQRVKREHREGGTPRSSKGFASAETLSRAVVSPSRKRRPGRLHGVPPPPGRSPVCTMKPAPRREPLDAKNSIRGEANRRSRTDDGVKGWLSRSSARSMVLRDSRRQAGLRPQTIRSSRPRGFPERPCRLS